MGRNGNRKTFMAPRKGVETDKRSPTIMIDDSYRGASKSVAARFYPMLSGHAMTAVFLTERWGWLESVRC